MSDLSGHEVNYWRQPMCYMHQYDPANDGPETTIIKRILSRHRLYVPGVEKQTIKKTRQLDVAAMVLFGRPFATLVERAREYVITRVAKTLARKQVS